ncbi:MAG: cytochrome c biogenesis CcdA family protein [Acidimicrobiales bacterium]
MALAYLPLLAFVAGVVSFPSPCCLPLIPSYLSYMTALPVSDLGRHEARKATLRASVAFVCGFGLVFTMLGISFALVGSLLLRAVPVALRVAGAGIIALGLVMSLRIQVPLLLKERRLDLARVPAGPKTAALLGMVFALGWLPCIGPVLATVLALAGATQTVAWGAFLLLCYSAGLGLPFVAVALGFQRARGVFGWLRRHERAVERVGGVLMVGVGLLFVSGAWRSFFLPLQRHFAHFGWPPI